MKRDKKGVSSRRISWNKKKNNNLNTRERKLRAIAWFLTNLHHVYFFAIDFYQCFGIQTEFSVNGFDL